MKDIGNVWCPWEVGHVKTRHAGSIPVTSVKVLLYIERRFVRRMLCGQAKSLGRLMEAYIGIVGTGAQPDRRYLVLWKTGFNSRYELRLVALSNYSGYSSGEQCSERGEISNPQA